MGDTVVEPEKSRIWALCTALDGRHVGVSGHCHIQLELS